MNKLIIFCLIIIFLFANGCSNENNDSQLNEVYDGLTLYAPKNGQNVYLINNDKEIVHKWDVESNPFGKLLPDGTLLYISGAGASPAKLKNGTSTFGISALIERSWDGDVIWKYENQNIHHDFSKLPNGNILAIEWEKVSSENKEKYFSTIPGDLWTDVIIEIDYNTQEIVWEWHVQDEIDLGKYSFDELESHELTHTNAVEYLPNGNSFNGKESVMISFRQLNTILIIDKNTKNIEWEYGSGVLTKQHNPSLLDNGNILVFDNQYSKTSSRIVEIDPKIDALVWEYTAVGFYSDHISGAQRLPNGNTLICEGTGGRIFEVTSENKVVWDYSISTKPKSESIFRAYKYGKDDVAWPTEILDTEFNNDE
ncbi:MAG: aryl-sulfate sulfotransferase [Candidatus Woesearchaeota archaeon]|jgi:hypothetical protein